MTFERFTGLRVVGYGKVTAPPDLAVAQFSAYARGASAAEATDRASGAMRAMVEAARAAGIGDADRQTRGMSLNSWRETEGRPLVYHATQQLQLRLRDVAEAGAVVTTVLAAAQDLATLDGFHLGLDDRESYLARARDAAMADARRRADQLARLADRALGPVLAIVEGSGGGPAQAAPMEVGVRMMAAADSGPAPVEGGALDVEVQLTVDFAWSD